MKKYPKEYLEEIKLRLKVSNIVGKSVQLKKRGKEFVGLSPFKNEKTPSFTVNDEKGFYHCFSSGEHGNIFDFIMKTQSVKFGEAVRQLASEAGMQPHKFTSFDVEKEKRYQTYKNILKEYCDFHHKIILENNSQAMKYLKNRGVRDETISEFKIGYVPDNSDFYNVLSKKFDEKEIILAGVVQNGYVIAERLKVILEEVSDLKCVLCKVKMNKTAPQGTVTTSLDSADYQDKSLGEEAGL